MASTNVKSTGVTFPDGTIQTTATLTPGSPGGTGSPGGPGGEGPPGPPGPDGYQFNFPPVTK